MKNNCCKPYTIEHKFQIVTKKQKIATNCNDIVIVNQHETDKVFLSEGGIPLTVKAGCSSPVFSSPDPMGKMTTDFQVDFENGTGKVVVIRSYVKFQDQDC